MRKILIVVFILLSTLAFGKYKDGKYYVESDKSIWFWKTFYNDGSQRWENRGSATR